LAAAATTASWAHRLEVDRHRVTRVALRVVLRVVLRVAKREMFFMKKCGVD
jgi:hypothetical protein